MSASPGTGLPTNRIEALADGVFAIALTLLILEIHVPSLAEVAPADVGKHILSIWPKIAAYAVTFVNIGTLWVGHHFQFHYIKRCNRPLLWLNLWFLMAVSFLPFGSGLLGTYGAEQTSTLLYGVTLIIAGTALRAHWWYASTRGLCDALEETARLSMGRRIDVGMFLYSVAIVSSYIEPRVSLVIYLLMPVLYLVPTRVDLHIRKK